MPLAIDIFSDVVCPWCFVGKRRLERALALLGGGVETHITWRPFELNPDLPREGIDRAAYRRAKFGSAEASRAIDTRLAAVGVSVGIAFAFDKIRRTPNTFDAHRLLWLAHREGVQDQLAERLFAAYFLEGGNVGDHALLADAGAAAGLDRWSAERLLAGTEGAAEVRAEEAHAWQLGIQGIPHFIVNGAYAVSGAQNPEILAAAFEDALRPAAKLP